MAKAKKKVKKRPGRPGGESPTTYQERQAYYRRREIDQTLEALGLRPAEREPPAGDARFWSETRDSLDRLEIVHAAWRFAGLTGRLPGPADWAPEHGWPTESEVSAVFGSWDEMLKASGVVAAPPERERDAPVPGDARFWSETRDALDRLEIVHAAWRFAGLRAAVPDPEDWDPDRGWPTAEEAEDVFGSWDEMLDASALDDAVIGEILDKALAASRRMDEREKELERGHRKLEEDSRRVPELRRREEVARLKRGEADEARVIAEAARDQALRDRDALAARLEELEGEAAALRARAARREGQAPAEADTLEALERSLDTQLTAEQARDALQQELEAERAAREGERRTIAELTRLLAAVDAQAPAAVAEEEQAPPSSVLEAVERAAATAKHLRFAPKAFETAADSPFRRPGLILRTLRALDEIAGQFAEGDMGRSLGQAAAEYGITHWRPDVAETTRKRYEDEYSFTLAGRKLWVGPHIALGSGSGAQFIARIYLHVEDGGDPDLPRGITVAVVGRHLPDTTT